MGGNYSRMQATEFPANYFALGFRQPDVIQLVNAPSEIVVLLRSIIQNKWSGGIKSEKKCNQLGVEIRLAHEPFSNDVCPMEKLSQCYRLFCVLLEELLNHECVLLTNGHLIRGIERNIWILRHDSSPNQTSRGMTHSVSLIGLEDWSRILLVNFPVDVFEMAKQSVEQIWSTGVTKSTFLNEFGVLELAGQPWDSYKSESEKTPLVLKRLIEIVSQKGFGFLMSTHVRGVIDTLFFQRTFDFQDRNFVLMSLNQQDQLRFYGLPPQLSNTIHRVLREKWSKGLLSDEMLGPVWMLRLKGSPWWVPEWDKDSANAARDFVISLLQELRVLGWDVVDTVEIYRSQYDKSLFLLSHVSEMTDSLATPPSSTTSTPTSSGNNASKSARIPYFSISSHDTDTISISGAPKEAHVLFKEIIQSHWSRSVKYECESSSGNLEFTLHGRPWLYDGAAESCAANVEGIGLLCWTYERLVSNGWRLVASADISSSTKYSPHTWIICSSAERQQQSLQQATPATP